MRLNLGCGHRKMDGWLNVDKVAACAPDQIVDLEVLPWPWADNSVEAVMLSHTLEHLGAATDIYLGIFRELYRVCRPGATITVVVPHPRHDHFLNDPTHVRAVTPAGLEMFSQTKNREWIVKGLANTPLGQYLGVDFVIESVAMQPDEPWRGRLRKGEISQADLVAAMRLHNNVIAETTIVLKAIKPATS
jgi:predicted SAM-dependent methyltransferase